MGSNFLANVRNRCYKEKRADYDLMSIITIYLGNERQQDEDWLIRFLQILFKDMEISPAAKKQLLKNEFDMDISADIEEEMRTMCNLSTGIYEQGMERGMERGREEGKVDIVLEMLRNKLPLEMIASMSKFSLEKVKELGKMHSLL